jgi:hypothetical protein
MRFALMFIDTAMYHTSHDKADDQAFFHPTHMRTMSHTHTREMEVFIFTDDITAL